MERVFSCTERYWSEEREETENFTLSAEGRGKTFTEGTQFISSCGAWYAQSRTVERGPLKDGKASVTVTAPGMGLAVTEHYEVFGPCVRQYNTVKNVGKRSQTLIHCSSARFSVDTEGSKPWYDPDRFRLYWCRSSWALEGQWKEGSFRDFGLGPCRQENSGMPGRVCFRSEGSWSTGRYYPLVLLEDKEKHVTWFIEHEGGVSWEITLGCWGKGIDVEANSADIHHDGFRKSLKPGESFETTACVCGRVPGGFEDAVKALTAYKRATSLASWEKPIPVCYNVFMGGIWGEPTDTNLLPLIDAAADAGCEVFCIDAGWYRPAMDPSKYGLLGDYVPDPERFGKRGLAGVLAYIKEKGMIPGLWFEFEAVNRCMKGGKLTKTAMLRRCGRLIHPDRGVYDLCDPAVFDYLLACVDNAYRLGMRYIKNDHNFGTGIGFGRHGEDFNLESRKRADAFLRLIDTIREKYPDMIIENCGSGGMRSDHGTLRHFHLQSTSDQERFQNYPAVIMGANACMEPEKAGNWVHVYDVTSRENDLLLKGEMEKEPVIERNKSGEETTFALVNGQLGMLYMSGHIDWLDEKNRALVHEGVKVYKKNRELIARAWGAFPEGFWSTGSKGWTSAAVRDEKTMLLAVWKIDTDEEAHTVPLAAYGAKKARLAYPAADTACTYCLEDGTLSVRLPGPSRMARLFEITLE